jgi:hypothetical protein
LAPRCFFTCRTQCFRCSETASLASAVDSRKIETKRAKQVISDIPTDSEMF